MDQDELYRTLAETAADGIWVMDLDGRTIYANPAIARIHGIDVDELADLTVFDTLDDAAGAQFRAHLDQVAGGALIQSGVEVRWVRRDASVVWMLVSETALLDDDGHPHSLLRRYSDHTERRALIRSLQASEQALQDQVAQNNFMQAVASAANEASSLRDVLAQARHLVLLHDDWQRARAFVIEDHTVVPFYDTDEERALDQGDAFAAVELELAERCFRSRTLQWDERKLTVVFPITLREEVYGIIAITSAPPLWRFEMIESMALRVAEQLALVAERERAQAELARARDQAMEASRQKSEFLATMSHEIRTPLNGVIGLNDLLQRTPLTEEQQRLAAGAQVASRALRDVINDILDFSKIEAGRLELERIDFLVRPLLDQVAGLFTQTARDKGLDLVVSCHPDVPATLVGDPTRLAQVITNLVSNAVKFTEHGRVRVVASAERSETGVLLRVEVRDSGIGVPADRIDGLFDPFTQADTSTTRVYGGTGLGLAISREIAEAMHGHLTCQRHPHGGSIFTFEAVLDQPSADGEHDPAGLDADDDARGLLAGRRVLVVDDTDGGGQVLDAQLAYWGVLTERADSIDAALARLEEAGAPTYDVVIIDLLAADRDGPLLTARLRDCGAQAGLLMLASAVGTDVDRMRAAGIDEVLVRPVLPSVLRAGLLRLVADEPSPVTSPADPSPRALDRGRVLVVEDNPINQMVASGLLASLGYASIVVDDGMAAIEAVAREPFDAVLMDVQMPRMDGYDATAGIRQAEGEGPRRPIIAMTAAAIEGERERCLAAGMDDFLTKPVDSAALDAVLARWVHGARSAAPPGDQRDHPAPTGDSAPARVLDLGRLDELREFDAFSYLDRAIDNFLSRSPGQSEELWAAAAGGDAETLGEVAHRLAGGALNLGVTAAGEVARRVETLARAGALDDLGPALTELDEQLASAREALVDYRCQSMAAPA